MGRAYVLHPNDNVATAIEPLKKGDRLELRPESTGSTIIIQEDIPLGHKVALRNLDAGENVIKYGEVIGRTMAAVRAGHHVHVHNVESLRGRGDLAKKDAAGEEASA